MTINPITRIEQEQVLYIHDISRDMRKNIAGNSVLVDPGQPDLLYCVCENNGNGVDEHWPPNTYRHTKSMQYNIRKTKKYCNICNDLKSRRISNFERILENSDSTNLDEYNEFLHNRGVAIMASKAIMLILMLMVAVMVL